MTETENDNRKMEYNNDGVRRRDRLMDECRAREILRSGEYGVMSMADGAGRGYGVPLNYVWDGCSSIYMHCAPDGRKTEILKENPDVSFCIVGHTCPLPGQFTTEYESVVLRGRVVSGLDDGERRRALEMIVDKFSAGYRKTGVKYIEGSFGRVEVMRMDIEEFSGKAKKADTMRGKA